MGYDDEIHLSAGFPDFDSMIDAYEAEEARAELMEEKYNNFIKFKYFLQYCNKNNCNGKLVLRRSKSKPDNFFWGCSEFPKCKNIVNLINYQKIYAKCEKCISDLIIHFNPDAINSSSIDSIGSINCTNIHCNYSFDLSTLF